MTQILIHCGPVMSIGAINREEDLKQPGFCLLNPPPKDARCEVCGKHISELEPFGSSGDPLVGDFSGELLVKRFRPMGPYNDEAEKAWKEAEEHVARDEDPLPWLIANYGEERGKGFYFSKQACDCTAASWECRDCIVLDMDEYFEAIAKKTSQRARQQ